MAGKGNDKKQVKENAPEENVFKRMGLAVYRFFSDLEREVRRITWPTKKDIKKATAATVIFSAIFIIYVGVLDYGFQKLFKIFVYNIK